MGIYSSDIELDSIRSLVGGYLRLPFIRDAIPGAVLEAVLAHVRGAEVLPTYDFVDVISRQDGVGWQIKSTKSSTPVTWKRAKIPNSLNLIEASHRGKQGAQDLGNAILTFCNDHAKESLLKYDLQSLGYARLVLHLDNSVSYFERILCTKSEPLIFAPDEFSWSWSIKKKTRGKEQLPAFHGIHIPSKSKWWAWHGLGENQLHFSGERGWWPPLGAPHSRRFQAPTDDERLSMPAFVELLARSNALS